MAAFSSSLRSLTAVALSGVLAVLAGCNSAAPPEEKPDAAGSAKPAPVPSTAASDEAATPSGPSNPGKRSGEGSFVAGEQQKTVQPSGPADLPPAPAGPAAATDKADSRDAADAAETGGNETAVRREVPPGADPLVPAGANRPTTEGWWRIVFSVNGDDYSAGFVKIGKAGDKFQVEEVRTNDIINPAKAVRSEATDKTVRLYFEHQENKFDYAGTLDGNVIRGNLQFRSPRQNLVRLVPVEESAVTDAALEKMELGPTFGAQEIVGALQKREPAKALREVGKTWRTSPILFMAYDALLQNAGAMKFDRPTVEGLAEDFKAVGRLWGERAEQAAKLNIAADLLLAGYETDIAERELEQVRKDAPELAGYWNDLLDEVRRRGEAEKARRAHVAAVEAAVAQIKEGKTQEGLEALRRLHAERPIDPLATYRLAVAERDHGDKAAALRLFGRLAALPQSESELGDIPGEADYVPPRVAAARLYEKEHGNRDGFEQYLNQIYREEVTSFLTEESRNRPATESERTVLVELFTGAMCPPCVAADVATEAVERSFPGSDVVVLRYHLHIPGPDPLANADTEARSDYYGAEIEGTPTIVMDGRRLRYNIGGGYSDSPEIYGRLAETIAEEAQKPAKAKIELSAAVEGENSLRITAKASGVENPADSLRLRVVVAESGIDFAARNGIREHEMIVRAMPGGAEGVKAGNGEFSFEQSVPMSDVRDRLVSYLDKFEAQAEEKFGQPFAFGTRPLGLRKLTVVAFLQDDATHEVLQAAVAPVAQKVELPPLKEKEGAAKEEKGADAGPALTPPAPE